jgi:hypothetical protein
MKFRHLLLATVAIAAILASPIAASAQIEEGTIESLLKGGWQIAGYTSSLSDNRSTFILFRHTDENYLIQCQAGYDVTRRPPIFSHCYKLQ